MATLTLFLMLALLLLIGTPISISLGLSSIVTLMFFANDSLASIALKLFETMEHYTLIAIPFFLLASAFLTTGGVSRRLINFANAMVGHHRGGLAIASVMACMLFAAVSGSSPATVVAIGSIVIAGMERTGYSKDFAAGVVANAGTLGILIPPSIIMVVYAAATDTSVGRMFMAGVVPGLVAGLMLMIAIHIAARRLNLPRQPKQPWGMRFSAFREAAWGLFLIVIILGGIYGGVFTPTEAAAVAAVYGLFVATVIHRDLRILPRRGPPELDEDGVPRKGLTDTVAGAARTTVMLMFIIANATIFSHVLTSLRVPDTITAAILDAGLNRWTFLILVNVLLLIAGNFMEPSGLILIVAPILFPIAMELGIDPIHLGIVIVVNMEIGMITPPLGLNLFVTSAITGMPLMRVVRAALPWMMVLMLFLILVTYVAPLSTWLPDLIFGKPIQ
ncbi:C4-dicarboxylate ABC transporter permease [Roseovarius sp. 22II1-1F6A]|nr:TRAP transporter large permease [Actibacterium sp.]OWU68133.1 C4-dicarboxylate ABC transporter permease [Roseovarius sp. 22II1-1F6A]